MECTPPSPPVDATAYLAVVGVISTPAKADRRAWSRRFQAGHRGVLFRYVIGTRGLSQQSCLRLLREGADMYLTDAHDNAQVGCVDKSFAWFIGATSTFPGARFIIKTDDDSATDIVALQDMLHQISARQLRFAYGGWAQYASILPSTWQQCGWGASPDTALRKHQACAAGAEGPYVFATGALEIVSRELANTVFTSDWTKRFVSDARVAARGGRTAVLRRWACYTEDAQVGFAVHKSARLAGLEVAFIALNGRIIDVQSLLRPRSFNAWLNGKDRYLTLHKWEPDEAALRAEEVAEDANNVRERKENKTVIRHKHMHAQANRQVRSHLQALLGPSAEPPSSAAANLSLECEDRGVATPSRGEEPTPTFTALPSSPHVQLCSFSRRSVEGRSPGRSAGRSSTGKP